MRKLAEFCFCLATLFSSFISAEENLPKTVVYVDVSGDMFHAGHVEFFKKARAFGDYLIVGVLADDEIAGYKRYPILTLDERVKVIEACKYVDEVVVGPPVVLTEELVDSYKVDFVVHGDDANVEITKAQYKVALDRGIYRTVPYTPGISTTNIISRITERYSKGEFGGF
jgi:cytidyltransferase-like protein